MQPIDFYFDFASPYGYFMSEKIDALAVQHGRTVTWRPILLFAALRSLGLPAPFEHPVKLEYITADFARSAKYLNVDYRLPPAFPALTQHAARAFYLLEGKAPDAAVPFAQAVLRGYFRGADDDTVNEREQERLSTVTLPLEIRFAGKPLGTMALQSVGVRVVSLRRGTGKPLEVHDDTLLEGGDTLVLSGKPEALSTAEEKLLRG